MIRRNQGRIVGMDAEWASPYKHGMVPDPAQDLVGFGLVVINARSISPAMRREIESHDKVLFSVGSGAGGPGCAIGVHRPCEVSDRWILRVGNEHESVRPIPKGVEFAFLVELYGDTHALAHALGAGVVVRPIRDVGERSAGVAPGLEVKPLLLCITVE